MSGGGRGLDRPGVTLGNHGVRGGLGLGHCFGNVFFQKASELVYKKLHTQLLFHA